MTTTLRWKQQDTYPDTQWFWVMSSEEYGAEEFGPYDTEEEALDGITYVQNRALLMDDKVVRQYGEPYSRKD
jgi:hypothetical protein